MASSNPQKLLGVRDGFRRFCQHRLPQAASVVVIPQDDGAVGPSLPLSDEQTASLVLRQAIGLRDRVSSSYLFFVGVEGGLDGVETPQRDLLFAKYWAAVSCELGEAVGSSSGLQLPDHMIEGLDGSEIPLSAPGARRKGGMFGSLTAGMSTQRAAVDEAVFNALSTLFYGYLSGSTSSSRNITELI